MGCVKPKHAIFYIYTSSIKATRMSVDNPHVLIVAEHASLKFGGEASLPWHYFHFLRQRGVEAWLVVHDWTRDELKSFFQDDFDRIYLVPDPYWLRIVGGLERFLPSRIANFTVKLFVRLIAQIIYQRPIIKQVIREQNIDIIHQPIPVSPKEPSMIFGMGVPVVIGPMNGGMEYPPGFRYMESRLANQALKIARLWSNFFNVLIPGKLKATTLLVANPRTKDALPKFIHGKVTELVENGVNLSIWEPKSQTQNSILENITGQNPQKPTKFVFLGRLVDWKAVDLLITACKSVIEQIPIELEIIGTGPELLTLQNLAQELDLTKPQNVENTESRAQNSGDRPQKREIVRFAGWLSQAECAHRLESADVLVLPSLFECGGAVVLEAMAMGIPVIATNWGGPADYLDESCGILVEPTSRELFIKDIAEAMLKMAKSPELRQVMGKASRQRILDNFDWEVKVTKMIDIYQEAIARTKTLLQDC